ncbi:6899_t:CDS:2 [Diversispora eburnea]|uniref:6899_t:CDS:1 n=1 Tax=Diversispora eburnea TaxID=1213867 RepID=A0A9N8YNP4_9GLOM|nr:6899_t:CDS:2 [Diversispora eburnea]
MAITTWLRVVREVLNNFGRFDYKLWGILILLTIIVDIICRNDFGGIGNLYQYIKHEVSNPPVLPDLTDLTDLTDLSELELPSTSSFDSNNNQIKISINNR